MTELARRDVERPKRATHVQKLSLERAHPPDSTVPLLTSPLASANMEAGSSKRGALSPPNFDAFNTEVQGAALKATKSSAALPTDITFHRSLDSNFAKAIDSCSERALKLTNRLLVLTEKVQAGRGSRFKGKARLDDQDDVVDNFESVVIELVDQLFERVVSLCTVVCCGLRLIFR